MPVHIIINKKAYPTYAGTVAVRFWKRRARFGTPFAGLRKVIAHKTVYES